MSAPANPTSPDATSGYAVPGRPSRVTAIVPVKALDLAKSRLALPRRDRRQLALAFATDTLDALLACLDVAAVVVITADPDVAALATQRSALVVPDRTASLDAAIADAVARSARAIPPTGVLITPADLPCLRPADVTEVLRLAAGHTAAFVPDRSGAGTTMTLFAAGQPVVTGYGADSAARHTGMGLYAVPAPPVRARHDVDTVADLRAAAVLGLGAATAAVLRDGGLPATG
ncbi:MAG: 2-phospho-L-lactate guanylyltransferase [Actinomycetales bacterium]|nr:2-phospho-L-lactate guanylyltransferase [Actinomycetales bacterium]